MQYYPILSNITNTIQSYLILSDIINTIQYYPRLHLTTSNYSLPPYLRKNKLSKRGMESILFTLNQMKVGNELSVIITVFFRFTSRHEFYNTGYGALVTYRAIGWFCDYYLRYYWTRTIYGKTT